MLRVQVLDSSWNFLAQSKGNKASYFYKDGENAWEEPLCYKSCHCQYFVSILSCGARTKLKSFDQKRKEPKEIRNIMRRKKIPSLAGSYERYFFPSNFSACWLAWTKSLAVGRSTLLPKQNKSSIRVSWNVKSRYLALGKPGRGERGKEAKIWQLSRMRNVSEGQNALCTQQHCKQSSRKLFQFNKHQLNPFRNTYLHETIGWLLSARNLQMGKSDCCFI